LGITPNFTLDIDPDPNEMAKISQAKKKRGEKKEFISRNCIQGFVMASSLLSHPDAGFLIVSDEQRRRGRNANH
jgi:hypothetical protein